MALGAGGDNQEIASLCAVIFFLWVGFVRTIVRRWSTDLSEHPHFFADFKFCYENCVLGTINLCVVWLCVVEGCEARRGLALML